MDASRFDALARAATRRGALRALAGGVAAALVPSLVAAQDVRRLPNANSCRNTGGRCSGGDVCCSGRCRQGRCKCKRKNASCQKDNECCSSFCTFKGRCF